MELYNAVNAAQAPVVEAPMEEILPAEGSAEAAAAVTDPEQFHSGGDGSGSAAQRGEEAVPSRGSSGQTREENAHYARMRRARRQMTELLERMEDLSGKEPADGDTQRLLHRLELRRCMLSDPLYQEEQLNALRYRRLAHLRVLEQDLRRLQEHFPGENICCLEDLGDAFFALREQGVDPDCACAAALRLRHGENRPPEMGDMGHSQQGPKEYYTPGEVDRLTEQDLRDPGVMEAVRRSMTRWKRR